MTADTIDSLGKVIEFYRLSGTKIHLSVISGKDRGFFRNGVIVSNDLDRRIFTIVDVKQGSYTYSYYDISARISPFIEKKPKEDSAGL